VVVTEDMTPAAPVSTPDPPVPEEARSQGVSATVVVRFTITETGAVTDVAIVRGSHPLLDPVILATVRGWKFKPALTADGKPVSSKKTKTFRYNFKQ
jgi:protein TonB